METFTKKSTPPAILIIDATLPTYDQDSGSLRLITLIKMLVTMGCQLSFFSYERRSHLKYQFVLEALGVEVLRGNFQQLLASRQFNCAWICRVHTAHYYIPILRLMNPDAKIFFDTVDIHYIRELRQAEIEDNPAMVDQAAKTKRKELANCLLADRVITVTAEDGQHLQKELPQLTFSVIPNIHQQHFSASNTPFEQREGLVFIGHYRHKPNQDAMSYFVNNILPKIHAHLPDIKLYIVGSYMTTKVSALASEHVKVIGWVDKVEPEFAQRRIFVSPLRYGAGMKGKLGQALSLGLPIVTTTVGAEGMGLIDGETVLIVDDEESFAKAVCRLYTDSVLWEKLAHQGKTYIEEHFGAAAVYDKLCQLLAEFNLLPDVSDLPPFSENNLPTPDFPTLPEFIKTSNFNSIQLPDAQKPRVSIIIPVFNQVLYTYNCLLTVQACDQEISKEVIIINNASTDETETLLAQFDGALTIINNSENQGFVQACLQGVKVAKGEFLLFLNNDTQVTPGWLSHMLKRMDTDSEVGITGAKLIYPNGQLQEAGGIIFNDGSGYNYGRSLNPLLPQFNQSREVDYCSGACLMVRKSLYEQLGGFDLRYAPAYYEDTDLCFAARKAGYKVFYCHESQVIHHEGVTAGKDINSGYKAFQAINQNKFVEKWRDMLATHYPPGTSIQQAITRLTFLSKKHAQSQTELENGLQMAPRFDGSQIVENEFKNDKKISQFYQQQTFKDFWDNESEIREHQEFETALVSRHLHETRFFVHGYCKACEKDTTFLVDRLFATQKTEQIWIPNWRERLVCGYCHLNNRQRAILHAIKEVMATRNASGQPVYLYAMEQITPFFRWLNQHFDHVIGSEYLGKNMKGGELVDDVIVKGFSHKGIRHENVENLSFADQSLDIVISNDVLEHVHDPKQTLTEIHRVLKPGGEIFLTVPFHLDKTQTVCRALQVAGTVKHLLPPTYHGNPLSKKGSLVYNDFGWDFFEQFKTVGFQKVSLCHYWSDLYGYLGEPQYYFWARKAD